MGLRLAKALLALLFAAFVLLPAWMLLVAVPHAYSALGLYRLVLLGTGQVLVLSVVCGFFWYGWRTDQLWIMLGAMVNVGSVLWSPEAGLHVRYVFESAGGDWVFSSPLGWLVLSGGKGVIETFGFQVPLFAALVLALLLDRNGVSSRLAEHSKR